MVTVASSFIKMMNHLRPGGPQHVYNQACTQTNNLGGGLNPNTPFLYVPVYYNNYFKFLQTITIVNIF